MSTGDKLRANGWTAVFDGYPPFFKDVAVFFGENGQTFTGHIVMSGANRVCLFTKEGKYYDLDKYIAPYWKVI